MTRNRWQDAMPPIPVAQSVPLILIGEAAVVTGIAHALAVWEINPDSDCPEVEVRLVAIPASYSPTADVFVVPREEARVDLNDPQGMGYALRVSVPYQIEFEDQEINDNIVIRHMRGDTTDADRFALASALAEVTP